MGRLSRGRVIRLDLSTRIMIGRFLGNSSWQPTWWSLIHSLYLPRSHEVQLLLTQMSKGDPQEVLEIMRMTPEDLQATSHLIETTMIHMPIQPLLVKEAPPPEAKNHLAILTAPKQTPITNPEVEGTRPTLNPEDNTKTLPTTSPETDITIKDYDYLIHSTSML